MQIYKTVTFFTLLTRISYQTNTLRTCVPNTNFIVNNYLCHCNNVGVWNEASCTIIQRRYMCQAGQIVRENCNHCVCQDNGQFLCTNVYCPENNDLTIYGVHCTPFRSYYINCSLCTCPASGLTFEARCSKDVSCFSQSNLDFEIVQKNYCIPNVMYIFPCLHCLCSENGYFNSDKCIEKCQTTSNQIRRCIPDTYYRNDCEICLCPKHGIPDKNLCSFATCNNNTNQPVFHNLHEISIPCTPFTFLKPKCLYCDCNSDGTVNNKRCVDLDCLNTSTYQNYVQRNTCSPNEVVPYCVECLCPRQGLTNSTLCKNVCSYESKLQILEVTVNESMIEISDINKMKNAGDEMYCEPDTIYVEDDKFCLCSDNGYKSFPYCISSVKVKNGLNTRTHAGSHDTINSNNTCEPGTYIEFDCNVCYCSKEGKIDPKWCTYDDCISKKTIQEAHKSRILPITNVHLDGTCTPGSISKVKCNFCICPESGSLKERACTRNNCYEEDEDRAIGMDRFTCEPLAYYEVDCNICFCPKDGIKNVAKCTKNHCAKNFLRTNECEPGHLFTDICNVCVCPPNGDRSDKACTEHRCGIAPLNQMKISLLQNKLRNVKTRTLDHCFPGEEFMNGCNICICPEMGLKMYASCEAHGCDDKNGTSANIDNKLSVTGAESDVNAVAHNRIRRFHLINCMEYKIDLDSERVDCTPGTMYFIRCKQCICPYMGDINEYCRPLPTKVHCEQAYPGFNYLPMGRKVNTGNASFNATKMTNSTILLEVTHEHTKYRCDKIGRIMDRCHMCTCEEDSTGLVIIEEHCFRSDAEDCSDKRPSFLADNKLVFA